MNKVIKDLLAFGEQFDGLSNVQLVSRWRIMCQLIAPKSTDRMLDVGCAWGFFERYLLEGKKCSSVVGIDVNRQNIDRAKNTAKADFIVASALNLPFKHGSFDKTVAAEVIEHLPATTERLALQEVYRVLHPEGYLVLTTPSNHAHYNMFDLGRLFSRHRRYKKSELIELGRDVGFNIEEVFERGSIVYAVTMLIYSVRSVDFSGFARRFLINANYKDSTRTRSSGYTLFMKFKRDGEKLEP